MSDHERSAAARRTPQAGRGRGVQSVLEVRSSERISSDLVRLQLGGDGFDAFFAAADPSKLAATDKYIKLLFAKPSLGLTPPYDLEALRETLAPEDMPTRRTYTIRWVDPERKLIAVDFVVHGDQGIAGPWAAHASPGDVIAFAGPGGMYRPAEGDVERLYVGDDSAIPAIAAALEALPADAYGRCLIEVDSAAGEVALEVPPGIDLRWVHRTRGAEQTPAGEALVAAVSALAPPGGPVDVFAHGEREAMKALRAIFSGEWGIDRRAMSLSAYWAQGRSEDTFQAEKREPIGQIFPE